MHGRSCLVCAFSPAGGSSSPSDSVPAADLVHHLLHLMLAPMQACCLRSVVKSECKGGFWRLLYCHQLLQGWSSLRPTDMLQLILWSVLPAGCCLGSMPSILCITSPRTLADELHACLVPLACDASSSDQHSLFCSFCYELKQRWRHILLLRLCCHKKTLSSLHEALDQHKLVCEERVGLRSKPS